MDVKIPLSEIYVGDGAFEAVSRVLKSGRYILGEETKNFEKEFAQKFGAGYAVAVSSGTSALFLSMIACDLGKGDEVIVPSFSFIASASPIVDVGAKPVFCDVDIETLTIDPDDFRRKITDRTKAVVPVHLFGHPANMDEICEIAEEHSLKIIEDCAQAHGSMLGEKFAGSFGTVSCYSFYPSKNMTVYKTLSPRKQLPVTERECAQVLSLPISPTITRDSLQFVADQTKDFFASNGYELGIRTAS